MWVGEVADSQTRSKSPQNLGRAQITPKKTRFLGVWDLLINLTSSCIVVQVGSQREKIEMSSEERFQIAESFSDLPMDI